MWMIKNVGERTMSKGYRILVAAIAIISSFAAAIIGCSYVWSAPLKFGMRFIGGFVFLLQLISTIWVVKALFNDKT